MAQLNAGSIIDPHHHLWDLRLNRHPWLTPTAASAGGLGYLAPLRRNYMPEDYRSDAARQAIIATVHVEASWDADDCVGETRWLQSIVKSSGIAQRYVAHVPLASPQAPALIEAQASFDRVVGIRDILSWSEDPTRRFAQRGDLMRDPIWRANFGLLARHNLVFELMVYASQLGEAALLARDFPDQQFVLEHGGSPIDRDAEGMRRWREGLKTLAQFPNVAIKISDLVGYDRAWTLDSLRDVVLHCIDCFGPARAMFGSDFPVAGLYATFDEVYDSFKMIVSGFSESEQRALFLDSAKQIYRVDTPSTRENCS